MNKWFEDIQFHLLPGKCILCGAKSNRNIDLCQACEDDLPRIIHPCWQCGLSIPSVQEICGRCLVNPPLFSHCYTAFKYAAPIDTLINQFKNHTNLVNGKVLSHVMAKSYIADHLILPDFWLPVPLHKSRLKTRGFNQAFEIATTLADITERPINSRLCRRIFHTPDQKRLNFADRQSNIRKAFILDETLSGETIGIVDDVITTTATVSEISRLLLQNGAGEVQVVALARTPSETKQAMLK